MAEHFDEKLDIRSFVKVHTSLQLLLNTLLNKQQKVCFRLNKAHTIAEAKRDSSSSDGLTMQMVENGLETTTQKNVASLVGYPMRSVIDRKLVQGVFDTLKGGISREQLSFNDATENNFSMNSVVPL